MLLANVRVCGADVWPTCTFPKLTFAGVSEGGVVTTSAPVPDKLPLTVPPVVEIVSCPLYVCAAVGEKTTVNWQLALLVSTPVQFELNVKPALATALVMLMGTVPGFVSVITCPVDDEPTFTLPKFKVDGFSVGGVATATASIKFTRTIANPEVPKPCRQYTKRLPAGWPAAAASDTIVAACAGVTNPEKV